MIKVDDKKDISLNGGVLIIGSLFWDKSEVRTNWRTKYIDPIELAIDVSVPIRYGRISKTRNCTYSMVFSYECLVESNLGSAKFIAFKNNPVNLNSLWIQCHELIKAECNKEKISFCIHNWKWGALGICINPSAMDEKKDDINFLIDNWKNKYGKSKPLKPKHFEVKDEGLIFNDNGILAIQWPKKLDEFDFFIATATMPNLEDYPSPYRIAERMAVNEDESYFIKNNFCGISTFQDEDIKLNSEKIKIGR